VWTVIESIALTLTLVAVVYYAWETHKLRLETVVHNELQVRPILVVKYLEGSEGSSIPKLKLANIGNGPALDVTFEDLVILIRNSGDRFIYRFSRRPCSLIAKEHEEDITPEILRNDILVPTDGIRLLLPYIGPNAEKKIRAPCEIRGYPRK
jgi:hypothetical protein